ncbi:hypothetical protein FACS189413_08190 [Bacteroidia bacterium]|nr:hypothetical protein FACS189413_08190 [Bacteroidia bacterium]
MNGITNLFRGLRVKPAMTKDETTVSTTQPGEIFAAIALALFDSTGQSGEIFAAIALALSNTMEWHDMESNVLTIHNVANNYSPWSSKIYTLREVPLRR